MNAGFLTPLRLEVLDDNANHGRGLFRLLAPLCYQALDGRFFEVPAGFDTNLADWPSPWNLPRAATLHDYLCRGGIVSRREADDLFYEAMLTVDVPEYRARLAHISVRSHSESLNPPGPEGMGHELI